MTLADLRALFRTLIFDRGQTPDPYDLATIDTLLNAALQQIAAIARAVQPSCFLTWTSLQLFGNGTLLLPVPLTGPYAQVHKVIAAQRTDGTAPQSLGVRRIRDVTLELLGPGNANPTLVHWNETVAVIRPPTAMSLQLVYLHGLPLMTHATNTPGQTGVADDGEANRLPVEYHELVALKAAIKGLKAMRAVDAQALQEEYVEAKTDLLTALARRDDSSEDSR